MTLKTWTRRSGGRGLATAAAGIATAALLAACGSGSGGGGGGGGGQSGAAGGGSSAASVQAAAKNVAAWLTLPPHIPITVGLTAAPPKGKKVFFVLQQSGEWKRVTSALTEAAKALGWSASILATQGSLGDFNGHVQQTIQQGADDIAVGAPVFPTNNPMVATTRAAKVPLFHYSTEQKPEGDANWQFSAVGATFECNERGKIAADQVIVASKANTLLFNTLRFLVFQTDAESFKAEHAKNCPGCALRLLDVPISDVLAGTAACDHLTWPQLGRRSAGRFQRPSQHDDLER